MDKNRTLYYLERWSSGGIEAFIASVLLASRGGDAEIKADIVAHVIDRNSIFTDKLKNAGVRFFELSGRMRTQENGRAFRRLIREGGYKTVHFNVFHGLSLKFVDIAKREGVAVRVVHNHGTGLRGGLGGWLKTALSRLGVRLWIKSASLLVACSDAAGRYLYKNRPYEVISNGIDAGRFAFSETERQRIRDELGITDKVVFGHVGRFSEEKNHIFLLYTFAKIKELLPESKLLLLGDGELIGEIRERARELKIQDDVIFLGATARPEGYLSAMDVFLLPSYFEGFGIAALEAQASGLPTLLSTGVSTEVKISEHTEYLPLDSASDWAKRAVTLSDLDPDRRVAFKSVLSHRFDVTETARAVQRLYDNENIKISVIVPIYNLEEYAENTLAAILSSTHKNLEVIAVNDGSTDKSADIIKKFADTDTRLKPIFKENGGVSDARNAALSVATGEYIGFVDGDDIPDSDMYEYLLRAAVEYRADIIQCAMVEGGVTVASPKREVITEKPFKDKKFYRHFSGGCCSKLYRRELIKDLCFPTDLKLGEDMYFNVSALLGAKRAVLLPDAKYGYTKREGSATASHAPEDYLNSLASAQRDFGTQRATRAFIRAEKLKTLADKASRSVRRGDNLSELTDTRRAIRKNAVWVAFTPRLTPRLKAKLLLLAYFPKTYRRSVIKSHRKKAI
ncbi:MAG: glycosyltransferase [Clostridia bacterium]|nr:glycosyltransferase [Clostridia bacterium]